MTPSEHQVEWEYLKTERLGLMLDSSAPATDEQIKLAEMWADEGIKAIES